MIIGLTGLKQSGKTTVADYLVKEHGFVKINFKDALVADIKERFPELIKELEYIYEFDVTELFDLKPPAMRALMQNYGTDVRRADDPNYWVKQWEKAIMDTDKHIIVDDVRFMNEAMSLVTHGGIVVKVERVGQENTDTHQSETEQAEIKPDFTISAEKGDLAKLYGTIEGILDELKVD